MRNCVEVNPEYGAIPRDGEYVKQGEVIGLATDLTEVVISPASGWVRRVITQSDTTRKVQVLISQKPPHQVGASDRSCGSHSTRHSTQQL